MLIFTIESHSQVYSILCVETWSINKVETTADDVSSGECWTIGLTCARAAEAVTIISMVTIALLVPARQSVHVDSLSWETHTHVPISTLGDDLHLEVVEATGGGDGVGGPDWAGVFVCLAVTFVVNSEIGLWETNVIVFILNSKISDNVLNAQEMFLLTLVDQHLGSGVSSSLTMGYNIFSLSSMLRWGDWLGDSYSMVSSELAQGLDLKLQRGWTVRKQRHFQQSIIPCERKSKYSCCNQLTDILNIALKTF